MDCRRRSVLLALAAIAGAAASRIAPASEPAPASGNFAYIYANPRAREEFRGFLANVFHLYPQDELDALIFAAVQQGLTDRQIYLQVQQRLDGIKPFLGDVTYSLPALAKQKKVLSEQTVALLDGRTRYEGYLEIGSNGRFLDSLEEGLDIQGQRFTMADRAPTMSPIDIVDRGQLRDAGTFVALDDYRPALEKQVPRRSIDLVTVYIGFHHCPVDLRAEFFAAIRGVLRPGGVLVVRDHDVHDEKMQRMVSLAHDVFNLGTREDWPYNERERRNFYSLANLDAILATAGFRTDGRRLLQPGDPTLNTLMRYTLA
jgi:SAM-dependent methyltransferase